jgi:L-amino acid N-acyltransferase YncA
VSAPLRIRPADPAADAAPASAIYAGAVLESVATFEEVAPDAAEMEARMRTVLERLPWLVAEAGSEVIGYAYAAPHHARPGYRWSVNVSVYIAQGWRGNGIGRALYAELLSVLRRQGIVNAYAGVALPNPASVRLHEAIGMQRIAVYERVGYKFDAWHDVAWYGVRLIEPAGRPPEPIPYPDLRPPP